MVNLKPILILLLLISAFGNAQDLNKIRLQHPKAVEDNELVSQLDELLAGTQTTAVELLAYRGAINTLKAKFAKLKDEKKEFFKEGVALIEAAIKTQPENIEIRYIRLSVQKNSPKFLGYHKNIEEDKGFILNNFESIVSKDLRQVILEFLLSSGEISDSEKIKLGRG